MTQRYERLARRLGISTTFHKLRHYSATELIAAGVDIRTVAGRLGHAGGGSTTLRAYSAWVSEADQRAAKGLGAGMPKRLEQVSKAEWAEEDPRAPFETIAADIRSRVLSGELLPGDPSPPIKQVAAEFGVSVSTAKRAYDLLRLWGVVAEKQGQRPVIAELPDTGEQLIDLGLPSTESANGSAKPLEQQPTEANCS